MFNSGNQGAGQRNILTDISDWFARCPLFTKFIIYICLITSIMHVFTKVGFALTNTPYQVVYHYQIYRLFSSPYIFTSLLGLLFGFLSYLSDAATKEFQWGTVKMFVDFVWKNFLINIIFVGVMQLLSLKWPDLPYFDSCYGLWPILFSMIVEDSLENPEQETPLMCLPVIVKAKVYPIILWALFSLLSQRVKIDLLVGMFVGLIHYKWLNKPYFNYLNDRRMANWSKSCFFSCFRSFKNYVPGHLSGYNLDYATNTATNSERSNDYQAPSTFQAFGGKGVTIGSDDPAENVNQNNQQGYYVAR
jgi:hypothetical protein